MTFKILNVGAIATLQLHQATQLSAPTKILLCNKFSMTSGFPSRVVLKTSTCDQKMHTSLTF